MAFDWDGGEGSSAERVKEIRKNYEYMRGEGLDPIPVFHPGRETLDTLKYYADWSEYIAMGELVFLGSVRGAGSLIATIKGMFPSHRFHILGVGHSLANQVHSSLLPYSVDVSTWNVPARFGHILVVDEKGKITEKHPGGDGNVNEALKGGRSNTNLMETLKASIRTLMSLEDIVDDDKDIQSTGTQLMLM